MKQLGILIVTALALAVAAQSGNVNHIGINPSSQVDYGSDKAFADAMRTHRNSYVTTAKDSSYWLTADGQYVVWAGLNTRNNYGTYKLYFKGQADVSFGTEASVNNKTYDLATNTTTATVTIADTNNYNLFSFYTNTRRTPSSALNTGVTDIKLMRPVSKGSSQSYPPDRVFTDYFLDLIEPFECIRFMDWRATNNNGDSLWSDRTLWSFASQCAPNPAGRTYGWQGRGCAWESVIMLANQTGKDAWINIPHKATDDYIRNLALLIRDGNAHTPGLNDTLKLYVEYSNEIWNWSPAFAQTGWCMDQGRVYGMPLNYDGEADQGTLLFRFKAMRSVRISEIFREVFGDSQMMSRVRPVIMWQQGYNDLTARTLLFIDKWYNKRDSRSTVTTPHPVSYYFYGGGGTAYWNPDPITGTCTIDNIWAMGNMDAARWEGAEMLSDANWCSVMGLKHLCYEGGAIEGSGISDTLRRQADGDSRMRANYSEHHKAFNHVGGEMLMYFNTTSGSTPGLSLTTNVDDPRGAKYLGVLDALGATPEPVTRGRLAPYDIYAAYFETMRDELAQEHDWGATISANGTPVGYVFRVDQAGTYAIEFDYSTTVDSRMAVDFQGSELQVLALANSSNATRTSVRFEVFCQQGTRYGMRLVGYEGSVSVRRIRIVLVSTAVQQAGATVGKGSMSMRVSPLGSGRGIEIAGLSGEGSVTVQLVNLAGGLVRSVTADRGSKACCLDTRGIAPGTLLLRVSDGRSVRSRTVNLR